jgi:predicted house-cleaning noncanonical NTP pyrophosphatase (MazG superfamily)
MIEAALNKLAEHILGMDEASLAALAQKYKERIENFEVSKEWEKSVIIFFIINGVRAKNSIFNEQILKSRQPQNESKRKAGRPRGKPELTRVK